MKYGLICDLDGTLWDACDRISVAWNEICRERGLSRRFVPDECRSYCGKLLEEIAALAFPKLDRETREELMTACFDAEVPPLAAHGGVLYPQFEEVMQALHEKYHLSIVSNCTEGYIEAFYQGNGTKRFFDDDENAGRTGLGKAENIRLVVERNGLDKAAYLGDTNGDYLAAKQAGVTFIHAAYGFGEVPEAKWRIRSLQELPKVLENIF